MPYTDPVIKKYIELIKANNATIKYFYQGEPTRIPVSNLPCCIISKRDTETSVETNTQDAHDISLSITIVTDIRKDLSTSENDASVIEGVATLYEIMEGRAADYTLLATSILDILRSNILVDSTANLRTNLGSVSRIDYGETLQNRSPEEWRIQARIDIVANFIQNR